MKGTYHFVILLYKYDMDDEDMNVDVENRELGKNPEAGNIFMVTASDDEEETTKSPSTPPPTDTTSTTEKGQVSNVVLMKHIVSN